MRLDSVENAKEDLLEAQVRKPFCGPIEAVVDALKTIERMRFFSWLFPSGYRLVVTLRKALQGFLAEECLGA